LQAERVKLVANISGHHFYLTLINLFTQVVSTVNLDIC